MEFIFLIFNIAFLTGMAMLESASRNHLLKKKVDYRVFAIAAITYLAILAAFRGDMIGKDTADYVNVFERLVETDSVFSYMGEHSMEKGYVLFCYLLTRLTVKPQILLFTCAVIEFAVVGRFFIKYSRYPSYSVYLFFTLLLFDFFLSGMRQSMAMVLILLAWEAIIEKKQVKALIWTLVAATFHNSVLICIPVYFLLRIKSRKKFLYVLYGGAAAAFLIFGPILQLALKLFPKYSYYLGESDFASAPKLSIVMYILVTAVVMVVCEFAEERKTVKPRTERDELEFRAVSMIPAICLVAFQAPVLTRFIYYFQMILCVYMPNMIQKRKTRRVRVVIFTAAAVGFALYALVVHLMRTPEWYTTYPYQFFFQS